MSDILNPHQRHEAAEFAAYMVREGMTVDHIRDLLQKAICLKEIESRIAMSATVTPDQTAMLRILKDCGISTASTLESVLSFSAKAAKSGGAARDPRALVTNSYRSGAITTRAEWNASDGESKDHAVRSYMKMSNITDYTEAAEDLMARLPQE